MVVLRYQIESEIANHGGKLRSASLRKIFVLRDLSESEIPRGISQHM